MSVCACLKFFFVVLAVMVHKTILREGMGFDMQIQAKRFFSMCVFGSWLTLRVIDTKHQLPAHSDDK